QENREAAVHLSPYRPSSSFSLFDRPSSSSRFGPQLFISPPANDDLAPQISDVRASILKLMDSNLIPSASSSDSKVFYLKMKGDYHRYLAEFKVGDERKTTAEDTMISYKAAQDIAVADLAFTHPIRLGLALNFSMFYYEILNQSDKACTLAKQ
ncbi:hypothetical protein F8388_022962, partial [Cannabis sativa]